MLRRTAAILATTAVLVLGFAPGASAQDPGQGGSYGAGASAQALTIEIAGQSLAVSQTSAGVTSQPQPTASANGAALLLAGTAVPGEAPVSATEGESVVDSTSACPIDLTPLTEALAGTGLVVDVACVTTSAEVTDGAPSARSESGEVVIRLSGVADGLLAPVVDVLTTLLDALLPTTGDLVDQLCGILAAVCDLVDDTLQINIPELVDELIGDLQQLPNDAFVLAEVLVAPTFSEAAADAETVGASAGSGTVTINLFPGLAFVVDSLLEDLGLLEGDPAGAGQGLLSVQLAPSAATVQRDATTGEVTVNGAAAELLTIDVTDSLGILSQLLGVDVPELVGQLLDTLDDALCGPLGDLLCITFGESVELTEEQLAARGYDFGPGTVGVATTATDIQLLGILSEQLGAPLLRIALSESDAAANVIPAQAPAPPTSEPPAEAPPGPLPRTGAESGLPVAIAMLVVAGLGVALLRRTRTV